MVWRNSPTSARMTVSRGAAGKAIVMFISNICRRSTGNNTEQVRSTSETAGRTGSEPSQSNFGTTEEPTDEDEDLMVGVSEEHRHRQRLEDRTTFSVKTPFIAAVTTSWDDYRIILLFLFKDLSLVSNRFWIQQVLDPVLDLTRFSFSLV